jgi:hypothetical protein
MSVFVVDDSGDLVRDRQGYTRTSGLDAIAQDIRVYLRGRQGEIPTRTDLFLPWQPLLQAGVLPDAIEQVVGERGVLTRPGVVAQETAVEIDGTAREADVTVRAIVSLEDQRRRQALELQVPVTV